MVTHDPRAAAIADRILYLADGMIVLDQKGATAAEVLQDDERARTRSPPRRDPDRAQGPARAQAPADPDLARDRDGRRDGERHLRPHRHDQRRLQRDLLDRVLELRRGRHRQGGLRRLPERAVVPRVDARPDPRRCPDVADGRRRGRRPGAVRRRERQGRSRTAARRASPSARTAPSASTRSRSSRARGRTARTRSASTRTPRSSQHFKVGADGRRRPARRARSRRSRSPAIVKFGSATSLGGATLAIFDLPTAQALFHKEGQLDQIDVGGEAGRLELDARRPDPDGPAAEHAGADRRRTRRKQSDEGDRATSSSFLQYFLLAFGGDRALRRRVRDREHALDHDRPAHARVRDAARRSARPAARCSAVVIVEGLVIGLLASIVGLFLGLALAKGLDALFKAFGADLPQTGLVFAWRTVIVSIARSASIVTLLASLRPALRATRVPPIAAVREGSILPPSRFARFGPVVALVVCAVSLALVVYGAFGQRPHDRQPADPARRRRARLLHRRRDGRAERRAAARLGPRPARRRSIGGVAGDARPLELDAQPGPHRVDRGGADDRARARDDRRRARAGDQGAVRGRRQQRVPRRLRAHLAERLHADRRSTRPRRSASPASRRVVAGVRAGDGRAFGKTIQVTGVDPGISKMLRAQLEGRARTRRSTTLGLHGAIVDKGYAKNHHLTRRLADPARDARREVPRPAGARRSSPRRAAARRSAR